MVTTLFSFYKKSESRNVEAPSTTTMPPRSVEASTSYERRPSKTPIVESDEVEVEHHPSKLPRTEEVEIEQHIPNSLGVESEEEHHHLLEVSTVENVDTTLVRDPGLRQQILSYPPSKQDEIKRAYIKWGPYQPKPQKSKPYPLDKFGRRFLVDWYKLFPDWLEYSPQKNCAFCFSCFSFANLSGRQGHTAFTVDGFSTWRKVNEGKKCAFLSHIGKDPNSHHKAAISCYHSLTNKLQHIENIIQKQVSKQVARNRLRVMTTTEVVKFFTLQGCVLRGRDESKGSSNRGNVIEMVSLLASYNADVDATVLGNAPKNATYVSPLIQKQILSILAHKTQKYIRGEIGDGKFCLLIDEARDESKREHVAIVLRFVDKDGFIHERFFDIVHVKDTTSATLKDEICKVLSRHDLYVHNIRGQGYDGASNMRGEWAGLQALFSKECPFAYYIHCFAHRLQLALVAVAKDVKDVWQVFSNLTLIVNIVGAYCKRSDQLRDAKAVEIAEKLAIIGTKNDELDSKGKNHIQTLKRAGDTRWGSHLGSISSLMSMYSAMLTVLTYIIEDGTTSNVRAEADGDYDTMTNFEFVFVLHLMKEIMEITDDIFQALQRKSQDILNAMHLVSTTKTLIQNLREDG